MPFGNKYTIRTILSHIYKNELKKEVKENLYANTCSLMRLCFIELGAY
jgi:hypothetical protein